MTAVQLRPGGMPAIPSCVLEEPATILDSSLLGLEMKPAGDETGHPKVDITPSHTVLVSGSDSSSKPESVEVESPALPGPWLSAVKSRRDVPRAAKIAVGGALALVLGVFVLPGACSSPATTNSSMIADTTVTASDSLHKRRHLTDDDFRSGNRVAVPDPAPVASPVSSLSIEERQRLREQNPEDLRSAQYRARPKRRKSERQATAPQEGDWEEEDMINFYEPKATGASPASKRGSKGVVLVPAAATVDVSLARDIVVRGGSTTVVALVGRGQLLPAGTKLLGRASADRDGFVTIRFRSLSRVDGTSLRVRAEALDRATGSPTLVGSVTGGVREDSVSTSVGRDAAQRGLMTVVGGGFLGDTVDAVASESDRSRRSSRRSPLVVTISSNAPISVLFLHDVVE